MKPFGGLEEKMMSSLRTHLPLRSNGREGGGVYGDGSPSGHESRGQPQCLGSAFWHFLRAWVEGYGPPASPPISLRSLAPPSCTWRYLCLCFHKPLPPQCRPKAQLREGSPHLRSLLYSWHSDIFPNLLGCPILLRMYSADLTGRIFYQSPQNHRGKSIQGHTQKWHTLVIFIFTFWKKNLLPKPKKYIF